jgi:hypothetical protein
VRTAIIGGPLWAHVGAEDATSMITAILCQMASGGQVEIIKEVSGSHWWLRGRQQGLCLCHGAYLHEHIVMLMLLAIAAIGVPL